MKALIEGKSQEIQLGERDESYGNTPIHIACSLHSFTVAKMLIEMGSDLSIRNMAGKRPEDIVDSEIEVYSGFVHSKEKELTLEKLRIIRTLF